MKALQRKLGPPPDDAPLPIKELYAAFQTLEIDALPTEVIQKGPLLRYKIELGKKTTPAALQKQSLQIAMQMKTHGEPLILPNQENGNFDGTVRLDLMTGPHPTVKFDDLVAKSDFKNPAILKSNSIPLLLGATEVDNPLILDLQKAPHLIVAGITGSGKTQILHAIIRSVEIHSAEQGIRLILIDPKQVDFTAYEQSKALRYDIVKTVEGAMQLLTEVNEDLEKRLQTLAEHGCRDILEYRAAGHQMPFVVVVIDELAELVKVPEFSALLCSLAARSRAGGIHFAVGTQHPVSEVITGLLKAQFPTRIATQVATHTHSRVAIDRNGAEKLLGSGDALLLRETGSLTRFKGAYSPPTAGLPKARAVRAPIQGTVSTKPGILDLFKAFTSLMKEPKKSAKKRRPR